MKTTDYKIFRWKGFDKQGDPGEGLLIAESMQSAEAQLQAQSVEVLNLSERSKYFSGGALKKVKTTDIVGFTRQLATMVSAGIPLVTAVESIAIGTENLRFRAVLHSLQKDMSSGCTFSDALLKHPAYFDNLYCSLVRTGEQSGTMDDLLQQIATNKEKMEILKGRVKKALFYPVTIFVIAAAVATLLLVFIVPQFADLFKSFDAELPLPTQMVVAASNAIMSYWWMFLLGAGAMVAAASHLNKTSEAFHYKVDSLVLKMPIFGALVRKAIIARVTRTLAITIGAGIPLVDALSCVARVAGNRIFYDAIMKMREDISAGKQIHVSMGRSHLFPTMVLQMVSIGEQSGSLEHMLIKVADYFEEQVDSLVNGLSTLIEPIMLVLLGAIIGGFVLSMYLPIFKLGTIL